MALESGPMGISTTNTTCRASAVVAALGLGLLAFQPTLAQDSASSGLADCAAVSNDSDRLACFDELAASFEGQPEAPPAPPVAPDAAPSPLHDDFGRERVEGPDRGPQPVYTANVTRCEENQQSGQTYLFFENGQVWRQANYRRLRLRNCQFEVELSEDNFGYSMFIPSKDRRFRVTRIR